jgi:anthranilate/para-aminobenzoate synthase component II
MQVTVNIPDEVAAQVLASGLAIDAYLQGLVVSDTAAASKHRLVRLGPGPYSPAEAGRQIRELRKANRLDGLKIKDLIEEGRRV